jgi:hypothetical protein
MALRIVIGLVGGAFAFTANMIAFEIIDQINKTLPDSEHLSWLGWGTGIKKHHRLLYPESRLVLAMNVCTALMVVTFVLLICLTLLGR